MSTVNHPKHYNLHPSGVECIDIVEHYDFNLGNAIKYIWRAGLKSDNPIEDLEKAAWYVQREIQLLRARANRAMQQTADAVGIDNQNKERGGSR